MIDMHCHLDLYPEPASIARRCTEYNEFVLSVTTVPSAFKVTSLLARQSAVIETSLGLHPQLAHLRLNELEMFELLAPKVRFFGEIGMDFSPEFRQHGKAQLKIFRSVLRIAARLGGRPMSIHSRQSATVVIDELRKVDGSGIPIFHWFTGSKSELRRAIEMDAWFSINPMMLKSRRGIEIVASIPSDRVLPESDGPFGKVNGVPTYPWSVQLVADGLARMWGTDSTEVESIVRRNLGRLIELSRIATRNQNS